MEFMVQGQFVMDVMDGVNVKSVEKRGTYYAIHYINENKDFIVRTWKECQKLCKGHHNMFHKFDTKREAREWLDGITPQDAYKKTMQYKKAKKNKAVESQKEVVLDNTDIYKTYLIELPLDVAEKFDCLIKKANSTPDCVIENFIRANSIVSSELGIYD